MQLAQQNRTRNPRPLPIEPARVTTKSLRRRFSPQEVEDLVVRCNAGAVLRALSMQYGVSRSGLWYLLQGAGVTLRKQGITAEDAEEAVRLYGTGLIIRQVVGKVGYSYGTIRTTLRENGVVR